MVNRLMKAGSHRHLLVAVTALAAVILFSQTRGASVSAGDDTMISFRVIFGAADTQPAQWDGELTAISGEVLQLRDWQPRPGNRIEGKNKWALATWQGPNFRRRPVEEDQVFPPTPYLWHSGLIIDVKATEATRVQFKTLQGSFEVRPTALSPGVNHFLGGRVAVDSVAAAQMLSTAEYQSDFASIATAPNGEVLAAWVAYKDDSNEILVRRYSQGTWSAAEKVSPKPADVFLVKLGRDNKGRVWAVWSAQESGNWDLYGRAYNGKSWGGVERITHGAGPDIYHNLATDSRGNLWVVWQGGSAGNFDICARNYDGARWSDEVKVAAAPANEWTPAIAADSAGNVYVAWDSYQNGNYDVLMRRFDGSRWGEPIVAAGTPRFEANVSLACDSQNRLWAAWNESGFQWGKDTGFLVLKQATALYRSRWISVAIWDGAGWQGPVAEIEKSLPLSLQGYNDLPVLQRDGQGRMWVFFRHRMQKFADTPPASINHRAAWEIYGTAYDGARWTQPQFVPFSQGRQDMRGGFTLDAKGRLFAAWPMDNRDYEQFLFSRADVHAGPLPDLPAPAAPAKLRPRTTPQLVESASHENESADVARIRTYEIRSGGKTYRIYRGDTHRHTEFSFDGNNDGSLLDTYRYALDAAAMDFQGVSEHNNSSGPDIAYVNYLSQQAADLFLLPGKFVPLFAYERSVVYPNGHRNVLFARRGNPTLPIPAAELKGMEGAQRLYDYLRKHNGIAISHTSATGMGTDWRDNDPALEPLVEIYQGDRVSAEHEGAPKAAYAGNPSMQPGGFRPAGYVWNAWAKGYKLGVQVSSDHLSTHISYACAIAEDFTREGLLNSMRKRHSYGATDNIVLDYRMETGGTEYLQGDIVDPCQWPARLKVKILGTRPIRQVDIIRNNQYIHTRFPMAGDVSFEYIDPDPRQGETYYYVRAIQVDDQMAWSSPVWMIRK
jgi:hypothetical protein